MRTAQPSAAKHNSRTPDREPAAEESLSAHASRLLRFRVRSGVTAVLDAGIVSLQKLRKSACGAQAADEEENRPRSRNDRQDTRRDAGPSAAEASAESPKPKRRLRGFLIYVCVLLAGGMGCGALAYNLLENLLGKQSAESRRLEATLAKNVKSSAETLKTLEEEKNKRAEAEKKLASSLAEHAKFSSEKQKQLDAAEQQLTTLLAGERARNIPRLSPASRSTGKTSAPRTGDCVLDTKNIASLKGCIDNFNR